MSNLEQDLIQSQKGIVSLLADYEKVSQEIIKSNYTTQLHALLDSIASFDHNKIKECQHAFNDEAAIRHIQTIAEKIKHQQQPHNQTPQENTSKSLDKAKEVKREVRITDKKQEKKGGILEYVRNKFTSKEKKATEMIFPEEEPKCYYDPVTKTYIFEGEEPQAPKTIPKPPSAAGKKDKDMPKKSAGDDSELGQLTAPPAFKRKSTQSGNVKGKVKIKEETEAVKEDEPLTFAKVMLNINQNYETLIQKAKSGAYERHIQIPTLSSDNLSQFMTFAERTLQSSEQISTHENKLIQKWGKLLACENRELKIMEKVIKEMSDSAQTYSAILSKIQSATSSKERAEKMLRQEVIVIKQVIKQVQKQVIKEVEKQVVKEVMKERQCVTNHQSAQTEWVEIKVKQQQLLQINDHEQQTSNIKNKLEQTIRKNYDLNLNISDLIAENQDLKKLIEKHQKEIQTLQATLKQKSSMITYLNELNQEYKQDLKSQSSYSSCLQQDNKQLAQELKSAQEKQRKASAQYSRQVAKIMNQFKDQIKDNIGRIAELQAENYDLRQTNSQIQQQLKQAKLSHANSIDKVNNQISKHKSKIETQLRLFEQKQQGYLSSIYHLQQQESLIQQYESALCQQNQLLNTILEKRLQLAKNPQNQQTSSYAKRSEEPSSHSIILELSDIVNSVTQTHLERLEAYGRHFSKLNKKYLETKEALNKIKTHAANENVSLNRNLTRLKGMLQTYKTSKDEAEERCAQLELECDKLKKKLQHYKEEDQFNKSYLSRLKTSKIHSQNESVLSLQEDKDELASQIDDLQRQLAQKEETIKKNQCDLEDLLINYEKNQARLLQTEKKHKQSERQLRTIKQQLEQQANNSKLLQLKWQNQRDKCEQLQNREESRLKTAESSFEKKLKLIKHDLDQAIIRQEHLRAENQEIRKQLKAKIASLQQSHACILAEANSKLKQKQDESNQIILLLDQTSQKVQLLQQENSILQSKNKQLAQVQKQLNAKVSAIIDEHLKEIAIHRQTQQNLNSMIAALIQRSNTFKLEQQSLKRTYDDKIDQLQQALEASFHQSKDLASQIQQYSQLLQTATQRFEQFNEREAKTNKALLEKALKQASNENKELHQVIASLKQQVDEKIKENRQFEEIIEKMSQDLARFSSNAEELSKDKTDLGEKLMFKDRQIETLSNELNKKSEELMVKTEELLEKDQLMLEQQEQSVMKKEQFDELKNQILQLTHQVKVRDQQIKELTSDLQELAEEFAQNGSNDEDQLKAIQAYTLQISELKQSIELKDQEITNFAENFYKLNYDLEQKETEIERLNSILSSSQNDKKQIEALDIKLNEMLSINVQDKRQIEYLNLKLQEASLKNEENKSEIQDLNNAILEINTALEESQALAASLQKENQNKQASLADLQSKLTEKQAEVALILEKLSAAEQQRNKEVGESDEIEGEMEYLLKQIEAKDTQLSALAEQLRLKQFDYDELSKKQEHLKQELENRNEQLALKQASNAQMLIEMANANKQIQHLSAEIKTLTHKEANTIEECRTFMQQKRDMEIQLTEKDNQRLQLLQLIQTLQKQLQNERQASKKLQENSQSQAKEEGKVIEDLIADIREKDEAIIDKQKQIEAKQELIRQLNSEKELNEQLIHETKRQLTEKSRLVTQAQIAQQEKTRIIVELQRNIKEYEQKCTELEANLGEMAEVIENLENQIQTFKNEALANDTAKTIEDLKAEIQAKNNQITELKRKSEELRLKFASKEGEYEEKIENLQREIVGLSSLKNKSKKLEQNLKALEDQNKQLVNEKVELMKSNNYLVGINQKLVTEKSPHNSKEPQKPQNNASNEKPGEKVEVQQAKKEGKGIFGALSSLFLTPTETDRLRK